MVDVMGKKKGVFAEEAGLVTSFFSFLLDGRTPWTSQSAVREFDYRSGRTDVLVLSPGNELIAFEAKLSNWRKALHQAWRNLSFSNRVYVVLPRDRAMAALTHRNEFEELGVGLCLVDRSGVELVIESYHQKPVILWLHNKARETLTANGGGSDRDAGAHHLSAAQLRLRATV